MRQTVKPEVAMATAKQEVASSAVLSSHDLTIVCIKLGKAAKIGINNSQPKLYGELLLQNSTGLVYAVSLNLSSVNCMTTSGFTVVFSFKVCYCIACFGFYNH
jgi:hypothetical protein